MTLASSSLKNFPMGLEGVKCRIIFIDTHLSPWWIPGCCQCRGSAVLPAEHSADHIRYSFIATDGKRVLGCAASPGKGSYGVVDHANLCPLPCVTMTWWPSSSGPRWLTFAVTLTAAICSGSVLPRHCRPGRWRFLFRKVKPPVLTWMRTLYYLNLRGWSRSSSFFKTSAGSSNLLSMIMQQQ